MNHMTTLLTINLEAVKANLHTLSRRTSRIMPMVKANAYGTDALQITRFMQTLGVDIVGVSHVSEALELRAAGIELPIFVINAPPYEAEKVVQHQLQVALSSLEEAEALAQAAQKFGKKVLVHLDIDTGMNRFGIPQEQALNLAQFIQKHPELHLEGVMTHFVAADIPSFDAFSQTQILHFQQILATLPQKPKWIHVANSPASLRFDLPFCNMARVGVALFGVGVPNLQPALSLESQLCSIRTCKKGETIGYNRTFLVEKEMRMGVIPFGYHDGWHRRYSGKGYVLIHGKKARMVGTICMDFMMVDLSEIPEAKVGDRVTLFNSELSPETVAQWGGTDVREVIACLGPRVKRICISNLSFGLSSSESEEFIRQTLRFSDEVKGQGPFTRQKSASDAVKIS